VKAAGIITALLFSRFFRLPKLLRILSWTLNLVIAARRSKKAQFESAKTRLNKLDENERKSSKWPF